jgi:arylsulfatase A-like enzyme
MLREAREPDGPSNFLPLLTDQRRKASRDAYGTRFARTLNRDRQARKGVRRELVSHVDLVPTVPTVLECLGEDVRAWPARDRWA